MGKNIALLLHIHILSGLQVESCKSMPSFGAVIFLLPWCATFLVASTLGIRSEFHVHYVSVCVHMIYELCCRTSHPSERKRDETTSLLNLCYLLLFLI